jgi:hypothetical protein
VGRFTVSEKSLKFGCVLPLWGVAQTWETHQHGGFNQEMAVPNGRIPPFDFSRLLVVNPKP